MSGQAERLLNVAHVTLGLDTGGQEKLLVEFARHADRSRFRLHFISLTTRGRIAEEIAECGWPIHCLDEPDGLRPGLIVRLADLYRRLKTDVVHTHDARPMIYGAPAARLARIRNIVHTRHGRLPNQTTRQRMLATTLARAVDHYICVSEDSARLAIQEAVAPHRIQVIHNGIDLKRFSFAGGRTDGPIIAVARLSREKGIDTLLDAAAIVARARPAFRFSIAGDGPCEGDLRRQARTLGISDSVRFLGLVSDIPALLAEASVFVLPSRSEGISLTLLEAMARGLPVVATCVGGNPEVVEEGVTGLLVPSGNPAALAQALLALISDSERCQPMGRAGRRRVEERFDVRRMVARYENMYASLRKRRRSGRSSRVINDADEAMTSREPSR